jgi:predicted DNA-binding transcriptional regulator YafY
MPRKRDYDRTFGQKLITLYSRLMFSGQRYSLTQLAGLLECSKQTVLRLVDEINTGGGLIIQEAKEGNRNIYYTERPRNLGAAAGLNEQEIQLLQMCHAFTAHLLGPALFEEAARALWKSQSLLPEGRQITSTPFAAFRPGSIDYTPHQETIRRLLRAMEEHRVCKIDYLSISEDRPKSYYIKPLKLFSHHDTIYLHARIAKVPGKKYQEPDYDPLLAIHRFKSVEITDRPFEFPKDYDFEKVFNRQFGIIKDEVFEVVVDLTGWAARYVTERVWSPGQKIEKKGKDKIRLTFKASSEPEVIGWLLSFGDEAKLFEPDWLVIKVSSTVNRVTKKYLDKD